MFHAGPAPLGGILGPNSRFVKNSHFCCFWAKLEDLKKLFNWRFHCNIALATGISISRRGSITHSESYAIGLHICQCWLFIGPESDNCLHLSKAHRSHLCFQCSIDLSVTLKNANSKSIVHIVGDVKVSIEESLGDCFVTAKNLVWQQLFHSAFHQIGLWIYCTCTVNKKVWSHTNQ